MGLEKFLHCGIVCAAGHFGSRVTVQGNVDRGIGLLGRVRAVGIGFVFVWSF